jgi:hypothetical protein
LAVGAGATKGRKAQVMQSAISKPYNKSLSFYCFGGSGGSSISFFLAAKPLDRPVPFWRVILRFTFDICFPTWFQIVRFVVNGRV